MAESEAAAARPTGLLGAVERIGNKLPDPAMLFVGLLFAVWLLSWALSYVSFEVIDPRSGEALVVNNLLSGAALTEFMSVMVTNFAHFHPVGVVLVAMLGIGVAEASGFINTGLRALLNVTHDRLLTPMVIAVGIVSHTAADAGYVLVIPLGGVIFYAAGRHPLAGIAAAFAGVSGGFSASFVPSAIDPLLQGLSQAGARILDPAIELNPLNNYFFTTASSLLIIGVGWLVTSKVIGSIVALIFLLFLVPGIVYGIVAGTVTRSKDVIEGMTKSMHNMAYYLVIMFFIAQFVYAFGESNLGVLLALQGASLLQALAMPAAVTIVGIVLLTAVVNIFVGSASGKWGLLAPIFIPMLMTLGISPDLTQAAYRVGDSSTNIITPLMPYFPLVVVYCQRYVKNTGIGTLTAMMLPYSMSFLVLWTIFLLLYAWTGLPLGVQASYTYP